MPINPKPYFDELMNLNSEERELYLKSVDLAIKEQDLTVKRYSGLRIPIMLAVFGIITQLLLTAVNGCNQNALEKKKIRSAAILDAIKTGDTTIAKGNLKFLIGIRFLEDDDSAIMDYLDTTKNIPVLPGAMERMFNLNDSVLFCTSENSYVFHADSTCFGLARCPGEIINTTAGVAIHNLRRKPCKVCY